MYLTLQLKLMVIIILSLFCLTFTFERRQCLNYIIMNTFNVKIVPKQRKC